jgi:hypothetical protein
MFKVTGSLKLSFMGRGEGKSWSHKGESICTNGITPLLLDRKDLKLECSTESGPSLALVAVKSGVWHDLWQRDRR